MTISANEIILVGLPYYYAVRMACGKRHKTIECPSISPSVPSIDSSSRSRSGFVVDVGCEQQISIDSGPRKFWSDCKEVQHTCSYWATLTFCLGLNLSFKLGFKPNFGLGPRLKLKFMQEIMSHNVLSIDRLIAHSHNNTRLSYCRRTAICSASQPTCCKQNFTTFELSW